MSNDIEIKKCTLLNGKNESTKYIYPKTSVDMVEYDESKNMNDVLTEITTDIDNIKKSTSGSYTKPADGIPKSDLSVDVQNSLSKADTALQDFKESDPTVPSHVKNITEDSISKWDGYENDISEINNTIGGLGTYSKPVDGIPKSDLSVDVQNSLSKADTALQDFSESDPTVPSHVKNITEDNISKWNGYENDISELKQSSGGYDHNHDDRYYTNTKVDELLAKNDQSLSYTEATELTALTSGEKLSIALGKISKAITDLISHIGDSVKHVTDAERTAWNAANTHAGSAHAPSNAEANVIETVKVNGAIINPISKEIDITVPDVNDATITIKQNGVSKGSFTTNQNQDLEIDLSDAVSTPESLGLGYGTCNTVESDTDKVATLSGYELVTNGHVSVKFTNAVPAGATLNINNKGAKNIYHKGASIAANVIKAGDTATFVYNGSYYTLISTDNLAPRETIITGTLAAGSTSLTLENSAITTDSIIDCYVDKYGVSATNMVVDNGVITITFASQSTELNVKVIVR